MKENLNTKFMTELSRCKDIMNFIGIVKLFGVKMVEEVEKDGKKEVVNRDFTDVFADVMKKFSTLNRKKKREIIKVLHKSNKVKVDYNGSEKSDADIAKDTEEAV